MLKTVVWLFVMSTATVIVSGNAVTGKATWIQKESTDFGNGTVSIVYTGVETNTQGEISFNFNFTGTCSDFTCDFTWNNDPKVGDKGVRLCMYEGHETAVMSVNNPPCSKSNLKVNVHLLSVPYTCDIPDFKNCPKAVTLDVKCTAVWTGGTPATTTYATTIHFLTCGKYDNE